MEVRILNPTAVLLSALGLLGVIFSVVWLRSIRTRNVRLPNLLEIGIGFVTNFFDTLGIGSYATTTSMFKLWHVVPDQEIPGTLNVGHTPPTIVEAFIFISVILVDPKTLFLLVASAIAGAWLGAGVVARWPRRNIQIGMGVALLTAATLFLLTNLHELPSGGAALALQGVYLWIGMAANFCFGALMTLGIGLYAPCMIMVSLLGMNPIAAFPIMTASCAFLMPVASVRFVRFDRYTLRAALGLALGGIPAVLIAAFIVKALPLTTLRWLVIGVVIYAATSMLRSAILERPKVRNDVSLAS